jgi:hypothetical protein
LQKIIVPLLQFRGGPVGVGLAPLAFGGEVRCDTGDFKSFGLVLRGDGAASFRAQQFQIRLRDPQQHFVLRRLTGKFALANDLTAHQGLIDGSRDVAAPDDARNVHGSRADSGRAQTQVQRVAIDLEHVAVGLLQGAVVMIEICAGVDRR